MSKLERVLKGISPQDSEFRDRAKERLDQLVMPHWALGELMDLALDLAGICKSMNPALGRRAIVTMAGDHGVVAEGVSKFPQEVTPQMVMAFVAGKAGINAVAKQAGAKVFVVDMGIATDMRSLADQGAIINKKVGLGTDNMAKGPAMSKTMATRAIEGGIDVAEQLGREFDIFGTGDMGIGNTTPSTAIAAVCTGKSVSELTGRGTGLDDAQLSHKMKVVEQCLELNKPDPRDGLDILAKVGGFEIGGLAGLMIGCASQRKPVIVDGFISTAAALVAVKIEPFVRDYLIYSHRSAEPGHAAMQQFLGCRRPLLDLGLRLGEGTGAALAMNIVATAGSLLSEVATFQEAAVSDADK